MNKHSFTWHFKNWLLPTLCVASVFVTLLIGPEAVQAWVISPFGFLENSPSFFLLIAVGFCVAILRKKEVWQDKRLRYWIIAFMLAAIYFGGEDENWGEYWLNFDAPQYFLEHNKEAEFNLHNMSSWFNQKPRLAMELWAIVACLLVPMGWHWPKKVTRSFVPEVLWPQTKSMIFVVVMAVGIDLIGKVEEHGNYFNIMGSGIRLSEVQEMVLAYLMLLYIMHLKARLSVLPAKRRSKKA